MKTHLFRALNVALSAAAVLLVHAPAVAQTPARPDKIMTISELRVCMKMKQSNDAAALEIQRDQTNYTRDKDALKAEQLEVNKGNDDIRARGAALRAESDAISARVSEMSNLGQTAKTDEEKAAYEAERVKLLARNSAYEKNVAEFSVAQKAQIERVNAVNARIDAVNARSHGINDRVEPQQKKAAAWREQCGNRRFREEDEVVIKKELAAGK
ncbi:MAG TPA: hypothetical protein PK586_00385 [Casimicrobium sp.]|nr:hypothetical protein [Casimicrobium sp.]